MRCAVRVAACVMIVRLSAKEIGLSYAESDGKGERGRTSVQHRLISDSVGRFAESIV